MSTEEDIGVVYQTEIYENVTFLSTDEPTTLQSVEREKTPVIDVFLLTGFAIIFMLAVIGNSLVIVTLIQNKRMRSVTNVFLLSLSISDLLFVCVCMPFTLVGLTLHDFIFGRFMCKIIPYTQVVSIAVSVWTMVAIALERYHAICDPLASRAWQTKSRALKIIALIWVAAAIIGIPDFIFNQLTLYDVENMKYKCRPVYGELMRKIHPFYLFTAFMILPLLCLIFAYGLIILELWRGIMSEKRATAREKDENGTPMKDMRQVTSTTSPDTNANDPLMKNNSKAIYRPQSGKVATRNMGPVRSTSSNNAKKRVVRMLIVLVALFFIAWTPTWIINMWLIINKDSIMAFLGTRQHLTLAIRLMSYSSACVNPIVYCFMNRSFRNGFLEVFKCFSTRYRPVNDDHKPRGPGTTTGKTRMTHPPDSTTNYTNVSSGDED